ncbi:MAG: hypothetical protein IKK57_13155 [Clostridia bacterium]|nr:hypothetical protein [Clostridia bacterium]
MTLLYALGLTLTLLYALGLLSRWLPATLVLLVMTAAAAAGALDRRIAWAVGGLGALTVVMWLLAGGFTALGEVLTALSLHINGLHTALPFVAGETAVLAAVLCGMAACFVTQRSAGPYPALVLLLLTVVLLWLMNLTGALWCLLPSVIASVALMLLGEHDISPLRVLPLAVAAVLLSYTAVAVGGAAIPAFKDTADAVRQRIYDIFFFTGSREEFSLADVGYYPQGEGQLGGPAEPTTQEVMVVITPRKAYLRGVIRDRYNGRAWEDSTQGKRYLWDSPRYREIRDVTFDADLPLVTDPAYAQLLSERRLQVRMLGDSASTLFVPQRLRQLDAKGGLVAYFNAGSEVFTTRNLVLGDVWELDAPLFEAGDAGLAALIAACAEREDPHWGDVNLAYRALPEHYFGTTTAEYLQLQNIVYDVIAGANSPYEAALRLQQHLRTSYTYTLDAPEQSPDHDFVCSFILYDKEGYCVHFASAMTIMCRMAGLPARYVEGFVATPDETGMAIVTGEQGHAWTEVYFSGFGWVTFDATPAGAEIIYVSPDQLTPPDDTTSVPEETPPPQTPEPSATPVPTEPPTATPVPTDEATPTQEPEPSPEAENPAGEPPISDDAAAQKPFSWQALLVTLGVLAAVLAVFLRILWMTPAMVASRQKKEFGRWMAWAQASHDALRQLGLERRPDETPMAFFARVDEDGRIPMVLSQLSGAESLMFYGHAAPLPEETEQARRTYEVILAQLTGGQKFRMALQRAFWVRRSRDITVR